ncbi:DNA-dependent protein kinase catalytic subunit-like isoform X2 [Neocloeon triangulifer]|uniref:DNA-dependent protein kinase catalytic subunit-like isoform X2 n=1 Tax=Neocloeon triangulifer TaxID=2078957 RepID=UPI00286F72B1|nr:DNA-dependent protein kinase catalytic subunit-like isoform X2 [Neocloeon triangulifer]
MIQAWSICQTTLQCLCVLLFERFPTLPVFAHQGCIEALLVTFDTLLTKKSVIAEQFIDEVVYQSIIRTCSHVISIDAEIYKESMTPYAAYMLITYDRFLPEWEGILNISQEIHFKGLLPERCKIIGEEVFTSFAQSIIKLVKKLDLKTQERKPRETHGEEMEPTFASEVCGSDPETCLEACTPKDFQVFINLVDLCHDLLPKVKTENFLKWADSLIETLVFQAVRQPLVSGFNKLLTLCLTACQKANYFKDLGPEKSRKNQIFLLLGRFYMDLINGMSQFKGDLLLSCIRLLLATPIGHVPTLVPYLAPPFRMGLKMGMSYLKITSELVETLSKWSFELPPGTLEPFLLEIVPLFDQYLHSKDQSDSSDAPVELVELQSKKHSVIRVSRRNNQTEAGEKDSALASLQRKILIFLAQLDSPTCLSLLKVDDFKIAEEAISWTTLKLLKLDLPFAEMKPSIFIDDFLPQICKLTLESSDRHTRITACEMLYSSVLFILGTAVQLNEKTAEYAELPKITKNVVPTILLLGCDSDVLVRQLFQPLVMQIVHYQTNQQKIGTNETIVLLENIMDGLTDKENVALRDFSSICLREFVIWTIKQCGSKVDPTSPTSLEGILRKISLLSLHPNQFKRLGAALAVNSLYTVIREQRSVDDCWMELLYYLVSSLLMVDSSDELTGIQNQTVKALDHVERVLREKSAIFNKKSEHRKTPPEFDGNLLRDAVLWLLKNCSSRIEACRKVCMDLVLKLAVWSIPGSKDKTRAISEILKDQTTNIFVLCEDAGDHALKRLDSTSNQSLPMQWLLTFQGSLECYSFLLSNELVPLLNLIKGDAQVFKATSDFCHWTVSKLASMEVDEKFTLSVREAEELEAENCKALIAVLDFVSCVLESKCLEYDAALLSPAVCTAMSPLLGSNFWKIICLLLFEPGSLSFSLKNQSLLDKMRLSLKKCLAISQNKLNLESKKKMGSALRNYFEEHKEHSELFSETGELSIDEETVDAKHCFVEGCLLLLECNIKDCIHMNLPWNTSKRILFGNTLCENIFGSFYYGQDELVFVAKCSPSAFSFLVTFLRLAFKLGVQKTLLYHQLLNNTPVEDLESKIVTTVGLLVTNKLRALIFNYLLESPVESVLCLLSSEVTDHRTSEIIQISIDDKLEAVNILRGILAEVHKNEIIRERYHGELCHAIMQSFHLVTSCEGQAFLEVTELVAYIAVMMPSDSNDCKYIVEWIEKKLKASDIDLGLKRRCLDAITPIFNWHEDHQNQLMSALNGMQAQFFPLFSSHLIPESSEIVSYKAIFNRLLTIMLISQSVKLVLFIASVSSRDSDHVSKEEIQDALKLLMKRMAPEKQIEVIKSLFEAFEREKEVDEKSGYVNQYLVPILESCHLSVLEEFFTNSIQNIWKHIQRKFDPVRNIQAFKLQIISKSGCYKMLQLLYGRMSHADLQPEKPIAKSFKEISPTTSLNASVTKCAYSARSEKIMIRKEEESLYREYQCCALNTLIAVICCLYPEVQPSEYRKYSQLLFPHAPDESHWDKIIDCDKNFNLRMDFDQLPEKKQMLVNIRADARDMRRKTNLRIGSASLRSQTVQYLASQQLFGSSLSEDVTRFDLSNVDVICPESQSITSEEDVDMQEEVLLELDTINKHPCMPMICGVIMRLGAKIKPQNELPPWMVNFKDTLKDSRTKPNVKLFLVKIILNTEEVFRPYAKYFIELISSVANEKALGKEANYILTDTVSMLLGWHEQATPDAANALQRMEASNLLSFLMRLSVNPRRDISRYILELIKTMLEVWKRSLSVDFQLLFDLISKQSNQKLVYGGLQLVAVLLANKLLPWNSASEVEFLDALLEKHFVSPDKKTFHLAAENLGLLLKWLFGPPEHWGQAASMDRDALLRRVIKNLNLVKEQKSIFYISLHTVHRHFPQVVDSFLHRIMHDYPQLIGVFRTQALDMVLSRLETLEDKWQDIINLGLDRLLLSCEPIEQEIALKIVVKMISELDTQQTLFYVKKVPKVLKESRVENRDHAYQLLMRVLLKFLHATHGDEAELKKLATAALVGGLSDPEPSLQKKILAFWRENGINSGETLPERFVNWLRVLFTNKAANLFLGCFAELLLEELTSSPDFESNLFDHKLSECVYEEMQPLVSWRTQHASVQQPLFVQTQASQVMSQSLGGTFPGAGYLRATQQALAFDPTYDEPEEADDSESLGQFAASQSSLLFNLVSAKKRSRKSSIPSQLPEIESQPISHFRFVSDAKKKRAFFAKKELILKSRRTDISREHKQKKEGQVRLYRKYRIGDFPDIVIPHSALLRPLQALAKREQQLSKTLIVSFFTGMCSKLKEANSSQYESFLQELQQELKLIFENTTGCVPMLLSSIMEISFRVEFELNPNLIVDVCSVNSLAPLGCLLLEKYISVPSSEPLSKKPRQDVVQTDQEKRKWLKLAELYQLLEDRDIVLAIISKAAQDGSSNELKEAVQAEAVGDWLQARRLYSIFLDEVDIFYFPPEYDFTLDSYCKCLERISKWEEIGEKISEVANIEDGNASPLWQDAWNQEKLLPWFLKSQIFEILEGSKEKHHLSELVKNWFNVSEYLSVLKNRFSEEMSLICLMNNDMEKSGFYSRLALQILFEQWSVLSTLLPRSRAKKLSNLQTLAELILFAEVGVQEDFTKYENQLERLCEKWSLSQPNAVDSLLMWEARVEYRSYFASTALATLDQTDCKNARLYQLLRQTKPKLELALVDLAIKQNNISVASKFIKSTQRLRGDSELGLKWKMTLGRVKWLAAQTKKDPSACIKDTAIAFLDLYQSVHAHAGSLLSTLEKQQKATINGEMGEIVWSIAKFYRDNGNLDVPPELNQIFSTIGSQPTNTRELIESLESYGQSKAQESVDLLISNENIGSNEMVVEALMRIVRHARALDSVKLSKSEELELKRNLISCLLEAMRLGSKEARMLFPGLLHMEEVTKVFSELFIEKVNQVPEWMFLGWLNQILAFIETDKVDIIEELLLRIGKTYTNALVLPFQFVLERVSGKYYAVRPKTKKLIKKLESMLVVDSLSGTMIRAFCSVKQPEIAMRPHIMNLARAITKGDIDDIKEQNDKMLMDLFQGEKQDLLMHGDVYTFVAELTRQVENAVKPLLENARNFKGNCEEAMNVLKILLPKLNRAVDHLKVNSSRNLVDDFCPWLAKFQACKFTTEVELFGQYTGDKIPNPKHHIKFSTFDPSLVVLKSLRQPIKLSFVGSNGRNYSYIVKAGEDLRQDERIQMLFKMMNGVFSQDNICRERQFKLKTYQVNPLNSRCGVIEFVPNCMTLKEFSEAALTKTEKAQINSVRYTFEQKMLNELPGRAHKDKFKFMYLNWNEAKTLQTFHHMTNAAPPEPLLRSFMQLSSSNEGFFWLRQNFTCNLAILSVCHWLLGIGDRHRSNTMICQRTGIPVGIDFGHAFGSATQFLQVPELMPFRLTKHISELMGPLGTQGTFRASMIHALCALRKDHELLLNLMQVFIQEPSLDWKEHAKNLAKSQGFSRSEYKLEDDSSSSNEEESMAVAFAEQKIELATDKLRGVLPALVTEEELLTGVVDTEVKRALVNLVRGKRGSLRDQLRHEAKEQKKSQSLETLLKAQFSAEQQVDCLIEQATDEHILGSTFWGWDPWY